jgi:hypothetical protein
MLLKDKQSDGLIEVIDVDELIDPFKDQITGQPQAGEDEKEIASFKKQDLVFPSGEKLPVCWLDSNYKQKMID